MYEPGLSDMLGPNQGDDRPAGTSPTGAARSVDVVVGVRSGIEMDDEWHRVDMDPAGCDIGGDEHVEPAGTKGSQASLALALAAVPVDGC